ncbi:putative protease Do-like 14 isoform X2 [Salvia splendens]|uniref:putative protease Do-like 14 isoform X2 n=1 Tax=Salvia splendens TaxID=180675 RepID=UPI001C27B20D|nr:putative protease Do-like 14 isoform X2 [Salvia splendens]
MHFLRKFSNKTVLIRAAALAAAGSGTFCFASSSDASISVSMPSPVRDSLAWPWRTIEGSIPFPSFTHSNHSQYGLLPLSFSKPDNVPDANISKGAAWDAGDSPKHCCNCLGRDTIANAAAKIGPAVVNLSVPQGFIGITTGKSIGSGTIIDEDGTILTCAHTVVDFQGLRSLSKGKVEVTLQDGRSFEGTVVNADLHADIAIVKIKSKTPLPTAKLGTSSKLRPGDWVVAMGCPLTLQNTVTAGIVSCVDRKASDLGLGGMHREYLQTDCAINPGNSGGPLVNADGEVIGVNIMKLLGADGLNFAVPIDSVSKIIEHFKRNGRVVRPWLGLKMIDLNDMIVAHLKERSASFPDVRRGVLIPMVSPGSPADRAGFRPGDVLVEFGGRPIESIKEVIDIMGDKVGKPFKAVVKRENNVTETLTVIPDEANPAL